MYKHLCTGKFNRFYFQVFFFNSGKSLHYNEHTTALNLVWKSKCLVLLMHNPEVEVCTCAKRHICWAFAGEENIAYRWSQTSNYCTMFSIFFRKSWPWDGHTAQARISKRSWGTCHEMRSAVHAHCRRAKIGMFVLFDTDENSFVP